MNSTSAFRTLVSGPLVRVTIDDRPFDVPAEASVAAAMLVAGVPHLRTTSVSGEPRAPYCMMGVCFDCLVEVDGRSNRQACLVTVEANMAIRTQLGPRALASSAHGDRDGE